MMLYVYLDEQRNVTYWPWLQGNKIMVLGCLYQEMIINSEHLRKLSGNEQCLVSLVCLARERSRATREFTGRALTVLLLYVMPQKNVQ